jgi:hypothetical protein
MARIKNNVKAQNAARYKKEAEGMLERPFVLRDVNAFFQKG